MTSRDKWDIHILDAIALAKTIEEIKKHVPQADSIILDDSVYCVVLSNLKDMQEKLFKKYVCQLKPLWQAFFSITHSLELLVFFWDEIDNSITDEIFYDQLRRFIPKIDDPVSLSNILNSLNGESSFDVGDHLRLIDRQEINELIKIQTKKFIRKTDCHKILGNHILEDLVGELRDTEITTLYFDKILEAELKNSAT